MELTQQETKLLEMFRRCNDDGKKLSLFFVETAMNETVAEEQREKKRSGFHIVK